MNTPVQVRKVEQNVYDVFLGNGFDNWSRVVRHHWGLQVVKGVRLSKHNESVIRNIIQDFPDGRLASFEILSND